MLQQLKRTPPGVLFSLFTDLPVSGGDEAFDSAFEQDLAVGGAYRATADKRDRAVDEGEDGEGKLLRIRKGEGK